MVDVGLVRKEGSVTYYVSCAPETARVLCHVAAARDGSCADRLAAVRELAAAAVARCALDPAGMQRLLIKQEVNP